MYVHHPMMPVKPPVVMYVYHPIIYCGPTSVAVRKIWFICQLLKKRVASDLWGIIGWSPLKCLLPSIEMTKPPANH